MKLSKYVAAFILFFLTIVLNIITGASPIFGFPGEYVISVQDPEHADPLEMNKIAVRNHVVLFTEYEIQHSELDSECIIYTSDDNQDTVWNRHLGLKPGIIRNPLGTVYHMRAENFNALKCNREALLSANLWYMLGTKDNCTATVMEMKNKYHYAVTSYNSSANTRFWEHYLPYLIFILVLILLLFTCYIDSSFEKKEIAIRVLHGDTPAWHYVRLSVIDTIAFSLIMGICIILQYSYTQIPRFYCHVYSFFILFLLGIWFVNLHIMKIDPKEMLYGHQFSDYILWLMSCTGKLSAIISCMVILVCCIVSPSLGRYQKAAGFFEDKQDYIYLDFRYNMDVSNKMLQDMSYMTQVRNRMRELYKTIDIDLEGICILERFSPFESTVWNPVYCNFRAVSYLESVYPEAAAIDFSKYDLAYLIPENFPVTEQQKMRMIFQQEFIGCEGYYPDSSRIQYCFYKSKNPLLCFTQETNSKFRYVDFPVICVASDSYSHTETKSLPINHDALMYGTVFRCKDQQKIEKILQKYPVTPIITNICEKFRIDFHRQKVLLIISIAISVLIAVFFISVSYIILRLDYQVNATELAIRKTLGESMLQKNRRHFAGAAAVGAVNLLLAVCLSHFTHLLPMAAAVAVPSVLFVLNILLICFMIRRVEKQKLTKILKGGAL